MPDVRDRMPDTDLPWLGRTRRVHFVGIGGIGMSGIAEVLANLGYAVSGSDMQSSAQTDRLASLAVDVAIGHDAAHVRGADVVVVSAAIGEGNPEVLEARRRHVPVIPRAEMLAELMRLRVGIAVAGAHGKTTTSSMIAWLLSEAGLDPTAVIGGRLRAFGSNARLGHGRYMVAEADESDRSFLHLSPTIAVVTNIDREHMDAYGSFQTLVDAFAAFANRVPFYGAVVACVDDPVVESLLPRLTRRVVTYGFSEGADVAGSLPVSDGMSASCQVRVADADGSDGQAAELTMRLPGRHNLQNALGTLAVAVELGVPLGEATRALGGFTGTERRYEHCGEARGVTVVDDYGHHPTEVAAVLRTARESAPERLVAVFQPHRYSRTRDLLDDFAPALALADVVVLTDIYAAGEAPLAGVTLDVLAASIRPAVEMLHVVPDVADLPAAVSRIVRPGDLVVTLGAGSIGAVGPRILSVLSAEEVRS